MKIIRNIFFLPQQSPNSISLIFLFAFFLTIFFGVQCKKDNPTPTSVEYRANTIFGKVVDKTTGQGIAHTSVYLLTGVDVIFGNPSWGTSVMQFSDSLGNFSFSVHPSRDSIYGLYGSKDLFFGNNSDITLLSYDQVGYVTQVKLQPMAWLKLHVKNVNPFDGFDEISFTDPWGGGAGPFYGKNIDTLLFAQVYGNFNVPITYFITKNHIDSVPNYRVYCKAFDTTQINIFY